MKRDRVSEAVRRDKRKKVAIISVCVAVIAIIVFFAVYDWYQDRQTRVFTDGYQTVTLKGDGTFTARLAHDSRNGRYTESTAAGVTSISFIVDGRTDIGFIEGDVLTIPDAWDDHHGHGTVLRRQK